MQAVGERGEQTADHDESHGIPIARRRTVKARLGRMPTPITVLAAELTVESVTSS